MTLPTAETAFRNTLKNIAEKAMRSWAIDPPSILVLSEQMRQIEGVCRTVLAMHAADVQQPDGAKQESDLIRALELGRHHARWSVDRSKDLTERRMNEHDVKRIDAAIAAARGVRSAGEGSDLALALSQLHQLATHFHGTNADDGQCDLAMNFLSQFDEAGNRRATNGVRSPDGSQK